MMDSGSNNEGKQEILENQPETEIDSDSINQLYQDSLEENQKLGERIKTLHSELTQLKNRFNYDKQKIKENTDKLESIIKSDQLQLQELENQLNDKKQECQNLQTKVTDQEQQIKTINDTKIPSQEIINNKAIQTHLALFAVIFLGGRYVLPLTKILNHTYQPNPNNFAKFINIAKAIAKNNTSVIGIVISFCCAATINSLIFNDEIKFKDQGKKPTLLKTLNNRCGIGAWTKRTIDRKVQDILQQA